MRLCPTLVEQPVEVVDELHHGEDAGVGGCFVDVAVEQPRRVRAPRPEQVAVLDRDAEQLGDDHDRQRVAERGDQVDLALTGDLTGDLVDAAIDQIGDVNP